MVRLIMGANGAGKTKQLIELIHASVDSESGSVVCIEPSRDMTYDISYNVRLVNASDYNVDSFDCLRGFLCGMYAGNFDISHVFVDNLCKIAGSSDWQAVEKFLHWLDRFSEENGPRAVLFCAFWGRRGGFCVLSGCARLNRGNCGFPAGTPPHAFRSWPWRPPQRPGHRRGRSSGAAATCTAADSESEADQ